MQNKRDNMVATLKNKISAHTSDVNGVAFSDHYLASVSSDKTVRVWSTIDYTEHPSSPFLEHKYSVYQCAFSPNGAILATCSMDGKTILWNISTGKRQTVFEHKSGSSIRVCRFSPDSMTLVTGSDDESLCLWDIPSRKLLRSLTGVEATIAAVAFSPDGALVVSGSVSGDLTLWDGKYGHSKYLLYEPDGHDLGVTCCDFSPTYGSAGNVDAQYATQVHFLLASSGNDNNVKLWDVLAYSGSSNIRMQLRDTLAGHTSGIHFCCFSPDGAMIASASGDKSVRLWNALKGEIIHVIEAHDRYVTSCAFSTDSRLLATGSNDRSIKVWQIVPDSKLEETCIASDDILVDLREPTAPQLSLNQWSTSDVCKWLEEIGMGQYVEKFAANEIDGQELTTLSQETLEKDIGILVREKQEPLAGKYSQFTSLGATAGAGRPSAFGLGSPGSRNHTLGALGHRNKILRAIQNIDKHPTIQQKKADPELPLSDDGVPDEYLCPITRELMREPVIAADGYTYERAAITSWIQSGKKSSPMTNTPLSNHSLMPNRSLKMLIQRHLSTPANT